MQDLEMEMSQGGRRRKMAFSGEHGGGGAWVLGGSSIVLSQGSSAEQ